MKLIRSIILGLFFISCSLDDAPEEISGAGVFTTTSSGARIEGELFLPEGNGPFPSIIVVPGSSNDPREAEEGFVPVLTGNGYAVYLYDKRGIGGSTGSYPIETAATQTEFLSARADDILGIIDLLKRHIDIDNSKIGLIGSSQGAWVNSIVYSKSEDLAFIVMASGGVASTGVEGLYDGLTDDPNLSIDSAISQLTPFTGIVGFDPLPIIETMTDVPVLWVYGFDDRSHPVRYDIDILNQLNRNNFTLLVYPNTGHDLIDATTGTQPASLIDDIGSWLTANN